MLERFVTSYRGYPTGYRVRAWRIRALTVRDTGSTHPDVSTACNDRAGASSLLLAVPPAPQTRVAPADLELRSGPPSGRRGSSRRIPPFGAHAVAEHRRCIGTGGLIGDYRQAAQLHRRANRRRAYASHHIRVDQSAKPQPNSHLSTLVRLRDRSGLRASP
jgi:hypothetical protein